jgi:Fe-S-cluster-containing dehydrogenase component
VEFSASRRGFLKTTMGAAAALSVLGPWASEPGTAPVVILENAEGLVVSDPTRCTACRRCELACTEFNEGRAQPALARIKIIRNYNFGPRGQQAGVGRGMGEFGNFRVVPDTCKQCPHPVPCATTCPSGAIVADARTKARIVDREQCTGCRICQRACPWEMMTWDEEAGKASKCHLCGGAPECVAACPALALRYVPWRDLTRAVPIRQATLSVVGDYTSAGCTSCHDVKVRR